MIITKTSIRHKTQYAPKLTAREPYKPNIQRDISRPIPMLSFISDSSNISFCTISEGDYAYTVPGVVKLKNGPVRRKTPVHNKHDLKGHFGRVVVSIRQKSIRTVR